MTPERILIIGSGAVGAIQGHYLAEAGARVTFLVRDRASPNAAMPRMLYRYPLLGRPEPLRQHLRVIDQAYGGWDQVWISLPSDALASSWVTGQLARLDPDTALLLWTPDMRDAGRMAALHPGPVSRGLTGFISFQTPLPGEREPASGFGFLAPPRAALLDDTATGRRAARLLREGGMSATSIRNLPLHETRMTALLQPMIAALEICDWSLAVLRRSPWLEVASRGATEARRIGEHFLGEKPSRGLLVPGHLMLRAALSVAPRLSPFPLETYLHYHFGKVGEQTREMFDGWIAWGTGAGLPTAALRELRGALP